MRWVLPAAVVASAIAGCGGGGEASKPGRSEARTDGASRTTAEAPPPARREPPLRSASCPPGLAGCREAGGRILFVERVDPDGDGDAHFVLASEEGVTTPGITVVDVRRDLRPRPLPGPGDELSAAGPVRTGSYGQRQIEATEVFARRR